MTALEGRWTPAVATLIGSELHIDFAATGTTAEAVTVGSNGTTITLTGDVTGTTSASAAAVSRISVTDSGGGTGQSLTLAGTAAFALADGFTSTGVESVALNTGLSTPTAGVMVTADAFALTADVTAATGSIAVRADQMDLAGGSLNAGTGTVTLTIATAGRKINLGDADAADALGLSAAELDRVTAGTLAVGSADAGPVTFVALVGPANVGTLSVTTGAAIASALPSGQTAVIADNLVLTAAAGVGSPGTHFPDPKAPIDTAAAHLDVTTVTGGVAIVNAGSLTVGTLTAPGDATVTAMGTLTVTGGIAATDLLLFADEIDLTGGVGSVAGAGTVTLGAADGTRGTLLGGAADTPGSLSLTVTDFQALAFPNVLVQALNPSGPLATVAPLAVHANLRISARDITLAHDVSADGSLGFSAGEQLMLASVTVSAGGDVDLGLGSDAILSGGGTTTVASSGGDVSVGKRIAGTTPGAESLSLAAPAGTVNVSAFAATDPDTPLNDLTISAGTAIVLAAARYTTVGDQAYTGAVQLTNTLETDFTSTGGGNVTFTGSVSALRFAAVAVTTAGSASFATFGPADDPPYSLTVSADAGVAFTGNLAVKGNLAVTTKGAVVQTAGTTLTVNDATVNVGTLTLTAATLGTPAAPITFAATAVTTTTTGNQYLAAVGTADVDTLDAGGGTIQLLGGTFRTGPTSPGSGESLAGQVASPATVGSGATLVGAGPVAALAAAAGGTVSPGVDLGVLASGSVALDPGSTFAVQIDGVAAGTGFDQLAVTGTVALGGATLALGGSFVPTAGTTFVIVNNDGTDPVSGTFAGLPEGSVVSINGVPGRITYTGGDGNDVALVAGPTATAVTVAATAATAGQSVTVTATVAGGTPGVVVAFALDGAATPFATAPLGTDGQVVVSAVVPAGAHVVTATYPGDATTLSASGRLEFTVTAAAPANQNQLAQIAVSDGATAKLIGPDGTTVLSVTPFGPNVATRSVAADATGDGVPDLIVGSGPGMGGQIVIVDGATGKTVRTLFPFEATFTGGTFVAAGDVDGDGFADAVVSADVTGGPRVTVFSGKTGDVLADLFGIDEPNFRGGARVTTGDLNGDGLADVVVAAGPGGGPRVAVFDGASLRSGVVPARLIPDFFAFDSTQRDGAFVAVGDVNGDGHEDLVFGGGPTGGPRALVLDGVALLAGAAPKPIVDFPAADTSLASAARVAVKNLDGDAFADVVVAVPTATGGTATAYLGRDLAAGRVTPAQDFGPFDDAAGPYVA